MFCTLGLCTHEKGSYNGETDLTVVHELTRSEISKRTANRARPHFDVFPQHSLTNFQFIECDLSFSTFANQASLLMHFTATVSLFVKYLILTCNDDFC